MKSDECYSSANPTVERRLPRSLLKILRFTIFFHGGYDLFTFMLWFVIFRAYFQTRHHPHFELRKKWKKRVYSTSRVTLVTDFYKEIRALRNTKGKGWSKGHVHNNKQITALNLVDFLDFEVCWGFFIFTSEPVKKSQKKQIAQAKLAYCLCSTVVR